jgi:uncharacterized cupin superfamily protein
MSAAAAETRRIAEAASRSFVVRKGVAEGLGAATPFLFPPDDPLAEGRRYHVSDAGLRYGAGLAESGACDTSIARMPHSEFLVVWSGEIALHGEDGRVIRLVRGDCAVVPAGARLRWVQAGKVVRSFVVFPDAADNGATDIVKIDPDAPLSPMSGPASSALLTPQPVSANRRDFAARSGKVRVGIWQATAYARRQVTPPHCELMHLLAGTVEIREAGGADWTIRAGEAILVPHGAANAWTSAETVRKVFCIVS